MSQFTQKKIVSPNAFTALGKDLENEILEKLDINSKLAFLATSKRTSDQARLTGSLYLISQSTIVLKKGELLPREINFRNIATIEMWIREVQALAGKLEKYIKAFVLDYSSKLICLMSEMISQCSKLSRSLNVGHHFETYIDLSKLISTFAGNLALAYEMMAF